MKQHSLKFWFIFWSLALFFLLGWFFFWNIKNQGLSATASNVLTFLPIKQEQKNQYRALVATGEYFLRQDGKTKTLLVLFQNNLELRPGGGFIGAFGVVKIKNGKIQFLETHDLSNFDKKIPNILEPPYPLRETLRVEGWKMRDSNFSPDFKIDAKKAEEFYRLGGGQEEFDGVVGITADMLTSFLKITGPIQVEGYPGTYDSENAIIALEYQVEKAFEEQGIERGERKSVINDLAREIEKRIFTLSPTQNLELLKVLLTDLKQKDIQLYFKDAKLQAAIKQAGWAGAIDQVWEKDYLLTVDANLGAFKSDYYVKRALEYTVDLSAEKPTAHLKITYNHTAQQKDWMTRDYLSYLRVYVPQEALLLETQNFDQVQFGEEFGKKYFGAIIKVPIGTSKTIELSYTLSEALKNDYKLKIQKQAGLKDIPVTVHVINHDGSKKDFQYTMNGDIVLR